MVEASLGLLTACLPTLRYLVGKHPLQSIINSIRSIVSLDSFQSHSTSRLNQRSDKFVAIHGNGSMASHPMVNMNGSKLESDATRELEEIQTPHKPGQIRVQHGFVQAEQMV